MPLMSLYDPYNPCMFSTTTNRSMYCIAKTKIKPDTSNAVWNYIKVRQIWSVKTSDSHFFIEIQEFSDVKMVHFRHDVLTRGVCIETCLKKLSEGVSYDLDTENFNDEDVSFCQICE